MPCCRNLPPCSRALASPHARTQTGAKAEAARRAVEAKEVLDPDLTFAPSLSTTTVAIAESNEERRARHNAEEDPWCAAAPRPVKLATSPFPRCTHRASGSGFRSALALTWAHGPPSLSRSLSACSRPSLSLSLLLPAQLLSLSRHGRRSHHHLEAQRRQQAQMHLARLYARDQVPPPPSPFGCLCRSMWVLIPPPPSRARPDARDALPPARHAELRGD